MRSAPLIAVTRPDAPTAERLLAAQRVRGCSYPEVGATRGSPPDGYRQVRSSTDLGSGDVVFARAVTALTGWRVHARAGVEVFPTHPRTETDATVVLLARVWPAHTLVACRVVYVVDEPDCAGFAYGSLPHHLFDGEERFVVERGGDGRVRFRMTAFFRPRAAVLRVAGPVVQALDQRLVRRYEQAMLDHARADSG